jgi:pantetheine-phosphate adenylyltransferase
MKKRFVTAIFPGSFDPITNGHLDVIERGRKLFDHLIVAVGRSPVKNAIFAPEERVKIVREILKDTPRVSVEAFDGLMVDFAKKKKANIILRGMRSLTDFHYEFRLAMTNRAVAGLETVFIMTSAEYGFTSSTLIREVASLGGDVSDMVPELVVEKLKERFSKIKRKKSQ